jgi:multiple antibiotic resistance protein
MFARSFLYAFIPIFVAMDSGGIIPVFLALTKNLSDDERRRVSINALGTAFLISVLFVAIGRWIFQLMGISIPDFEIAGGILLLVLAIVEMLHLGKEILPGSHVGAVPLGTPMIVGPAVLTSLIILIPLYGYVLTLGALCANLILVGICFTQSKRLVVWLGEDGLRALSQVISLFLAAIAVSMIRRGFQTLLPAIPIPR